MNLKSEFEAICPCCQATLVIDANLRRIVRHEEPVRGDKPELSDAHRLLDEQAQRREDLFQKSVAAERTRGDAVRGGAPSGQRRTDHQADAGFRFGLI